DVNISSPAVSEILEFNGTNWVNFATSSLKLSGTNFNNSVNDAIIASTTLTAAGNLNVLSSLNVPNGVAYLSSGMTEVGPTLINSAGSNNTSIAASSNSGTVSIGDAANVVNLNASATTIAHASTTALSVGSGTNGTTINNLIVSTCNLNTITINLGATGIETCGNGTEGLVNGDKVFVTASNLDTGFIITNASTTGSGTTINVAIKNTNGPGGSTSNNAAVINFISIR
ncbi:MAG: hypothetical protein HY226_04720, partial [Candidatus Vogelbacteria bacterium]|nr:hypothetical protein [Candidatus Vogelbacteria bacterium]